MSNTETDTLDQLQCKLGVQFKDVKLLERALTHRSAATENLCESNERMEFLGDSIVGMVISDTLYKLHPDFSEGQLAKSKAFIVSENSLAAAAIDIELNRFVLMSPGEAASGGRRRRSILSDALEAVIGAVYLDAGMAAARRVIKGILKNIIDIAESDAHRGDYKSSLQEKTQAMCRQAPTYRVTVESGSEHDKTFAVEAILLNEVIGAGVGKSKKEAEQIAARDALERMEDTSAATTIDETQV